MQTSLPSHTLYRIRLTLIFFISALFVSGITAFALETEMRWMTAHMGWLPQELQEYFNYIRDALVHMNQLYPQLAYGYDWLAFAHLVIAALFIGPLRDPVRNIFIIEWGMFACVAVIPLAFICGEIREIPLFWRLVDCSFGVFGIIPLWLVRKWVKKTNP